jgi:hypothetical protein
MNSARRVSNGLPCDAGMAGTIDAAGFGIAGQNATKAGQ